MQVTRHIFGVRSGIHSFIQLEKIDWLIYSVKEDNIYSVILWLI